MATDDSARDQLTKRVIPQMKLSDASNPLTAPLKLPALPYSAATCAQRRFSVEGNAIVTGGAGSIGLTAIRALLEHGASGIAIFDVPASFATAQPSIDALKSDFPNSKMVTYEVDVRDENKVQSAVDQAAQELSGVGTGKLDMLLCFAGVVGTAHAHDMKPEEWRRVMDVNVTGSWLCAQSVGKQMIAQGKGGSILLTASISAHHVNFPQPQVAYNASKAAVLHLARSLSGEWARHGIRVNTISPGYMDTILNEGDGLAECRAIWASRNPLGRMGDPEELTGAIVLLCSRVAGRYITGADIIVDGGGSIF